MKKKLLDYFNNFPFINIVAIILYPQVRVRSVEKWLGLYYGKLGITYDNKGYAQNVMHALYECFIEYALKYTTNDIGDIDSHGLEHYYPLLDSIMKKANVYTYLRYSGSGSGSQKTSYTTSTNGSGGGVTVTK